MVGKASITCVHDRDLATGPLSHEIDIAGGLWSLGR